MNTRTTPRLPTKAARHGLALLTGKPFLPVVLLLALLLCAGCVTRTTTRDRHVSELTHQTPGDNPRKVQHKTIWIWQAEFWNAE